eukprot:scaffold4470_cov255-Prasinococcus_capsulatus_cf.AAC.18
MCRRVPLLLLRLVVFACCGIHRSLGDLGIRSFKLFSNAGVTPPIRDNPHLRHQGPNISFVGGKRSDALLTEGTWSAQLGSFRLPSMLKSIQPPMDTRRSTGPSNVLPFSPGKTTQKPPLPYDYNDDYTIPMQLLDANLPAPHESSLSRQVSVPSLDWAPRTTPAAMFVATDRDEPERAAMPPAAPSTPMPPPQGPASSTPTTSMARRCAEVTPAVSRKCKGRGKGATLDSSCVTSSRPAVALPGASLSVRAGSGPCMPPVPWLRLVHELHLLLHDAGRLPIHSLKGMCTSPNHRPADFLLHGENKSRVRGTFRNVDWPSNREPPWRAQDVDACKRHTPALP